MQIWQDIKQVFVLLLNASNPFLVCFFKDLYIKGFDSTGEPAAVVVLPIQVKIVEEIQSESTAAGLLFGWSLKGELGQSVGFFPAPANRYI